MSVAVMARLGNIQRQLDVLHEMIDALAVRVAKIEAERLSAGAKVGRN